MTMPTAAVSAVATFDMPLPLTGTQRMMLRDVLHVMWRQHVQMITTLAVRYHADEDAAVGAELAKVRRALVDIESALDRLDARTYGHCDACERRIPFEQLEADPAGRYCRRCQPAGSGSATNTGISRPARS